MGYHPPERFESADIAHEIDRDTYQGEVPELRSRLRAAQYQMLEEGHRALMIERTRSRV